ncbi:hypothetical protein BU17DRAFT_56111 [Hysterangium stoloniferum]|nr:hypothetical protein BU17DRAFT_56111 [Hysterangium stoloniferum]
MYRGYVDVKDRIKQWNIIPGDIIRTRGGSDHLQEVFGVNKFKNLVYLKGSQDVDEGGMPKTPSEHYSKCQLYLGEYEFPPAKGETEPTRQHVFALDLRCTAAKWSPSLGRYHWERYAVRTTPALPGNEKKVHIPIPWPKHEKPSPPPREYFDTPAEVVREITWKPSTMFYPASNVGKLKRLQDAYLYYIRSPPPGLPTIPYDPTNAPPMEHVISLELSNPHGGTRKMLRSIARAKERQVRQKAFIAAELANLEGRTKKEALKEAEFKWEEFRRKEVLAERKKRWIKRGSLARLQRKRGRKARKERKQQEKLKALVLSPKANQVLPQQ